MRAAEVGNQRFRPTKWREGYEFDEVDAMLDRIESTLAGYEQGVPSDPLTVEEVVAARFTPTRFRVGYDQRDVDDFLDKVVVELRRHESN